MKIGINLLLFGDVVEAGCMARFRRIRALGFDGVEVPVFDPSAVAAAKIRRRAEAAGLGVTASGALAPGLRFYGSPGAAKKAGAYLRGVIETAAALGADVLCGPLCKPVGDLDLSVPLEVQRQRAAESFRPVAEFAEKRHVVLAIEPLNRFETNFLNTVEQGVQFCAEVGSPAVGLLLDTFHMGIEEKRVAEAIDGAARDGALAHFHASENDRGIPGTGQVRWPDVRKALRKAAYDGWVVLETFSQTCEAIKTAVSCWRPFYPSEEAYLAGGIRFARKTFGDRS